MAPAGARKNKRGPMTVCVATLFTWAYGPKDIGKAAFTASDRQITAGDVEFEPDQTKVGFLTPKVLIMIAGDYPTHSEALIHTQRQLAAVPESDPGVIAELYASFIREIKYRHAMSTYLSPVGLDREEFLRRQKEFSPEFINKITNQLQSYQGEQTEAIIVGGDDLMASIYVVDTESMVTCHNDVGFAAIGIGAWHAKSQLMQARYSNRLTYVPSLALTYAAKKRAEIAPGVGKNTDMYLVTKKGHEIVMPELFSKTEEVYREFEERQNALALESIGKLTAYFNEVAERQKHQTSQAATHEPTSNTEAEDESEPDIEDEGDA